MDDVVVVEVTTSAAVAELVSDWLWGAGATAVVEQAALDSFFPDVVSLVADLRPEVARVVLAGERAIGGLIAGGDADERAIVGDEVGTVAMAGDQLGGAVLGPVGDLILSARIIGTREDDESSARTWRDFAEPVTCGRITIVPAWLGARESTADAGGALGARESTAGAGGALGARESTAGAGGAPGATVSGGVDLRMEPGDAFGAGTHITTRLCVEAVDELVEPGDVVLDFGCGTGVLGIAAALLGAGHVVALDIDLEAVRVTTQMAEQNGVADRVTASGAGLGDVQGVFDLVLANVLIGVVEDHGPLLVGSVAPDGILVASGVLASQQDRVVAAVSPLQLVDSIEQDGWVRMTFARGSTGRLPKVLCADLVE